MAPVRESGDQVQAFRVVWRTDDDGLSHAWDSIVLQRHLCDQIVAQSPSLQMFVSCISGVFTNARGAGYGPATRPVYPAVSYWAVFDEVTPSSSVDLSLRLNAACPNAEVKHVKSAANWQEYKSLAADCGTLFVALKDHNSRYVMQKISRSLAATGNSKANHNRANAKVSVVTSSKYLRQLTASVESMKAAGLSIDVEVLEGN